MADSTLTRQNRDYAIRTREEARALGLKQYYTGKPCKHGHVEPRAVVNGTCLECVQTRWKDWYQSDDAKQCVRRAVAAHRDRNPDYARQRYWADPVKAIAASSASHRKNPVAARKRRAQWKKRNPHLVAAHRAKRRAVLLQATPPWLTKEHWQEIDALYLDAATRPGGPWHVDHIIPLIHDKVCGLHVPWNLQVITAAENCAKNNLFDGARPRHWRNA